MQGYIVYRFTHEGYLDEMLKTTSLDKAQEEYRALKEDGIVGHIDVVDLEESEFEEVI